MELIDHKLIGIVAALGSAFSWAIASILFKRLGESLSSFAMTLVKGAISVILLALTLFITGYEQIAIQPLFLLIFSGLLGITLGDTLFFEALQYLDPHSLILLGMLGQVFTVILAVIFLGETLNLAAIFGIFLIILGVTIVLYSKLSGDKQDSNWRGIIFGLLFVICMLVSIIITKKGLDSVSALQATFIRMMAGTTGMLFFGLATKRLRNWILPLQQWRLFSLFFVSVLVITFGGFWLSHVAIKNVDVWLANTLISTEPIFILPLAAIFLGEKIMFAAVLGTIVTMSGLFILFFF